MSAGLAPPVPLPDPPGDPGAWAALLDQLTDAGFAAGLGVHLLGPATAVPGWQGADAAAAAAEVAAALVVATDLHTALTVAQRRLAAHHDQWLAACARAAALRDAQRTQYADVSAQLAVLTAPGLEQGTGAVPAEAADLARAVERDDDARGAEHRALVEALAEDAAAVAAVLAAAAGPLGGAARRGDAGRVTARLATALPGWGDAALTALGVQAAAELTGRSTADQLDAAAARWAGHASSPAFADALVGRLGDEGVTWLLTVVGSRSGTTDDEPLADLLAAAAATSTARGTGARAGGVLAGVRLDPGDRDPTVDVVAVGMGAVLTRLAGRPGPGGTGLAVAWGRQLLAREAARGLPATAGVAAPAADPVVATLGVLASAAEPAAAADLLATPQAWTALLSRSWPGGAADLGSVVALAAQAPAPAAVRSGSAALAALGQGLGPGSPERVLVDQEALQEVGGAVADLVAAQAGDVVVPLLGAAVAGPLDPDADRALRGLAHLVADDARDRTVTAAVGAALGSGSAAGAVAGGYVAVQEHGQRLAYALTWSREQSAAVDRQLAWDLAFSWPTELARTPGAAVVADVADELLDAAAGVLGADGEVDLPPDAGPVRTAADAREWALRTVDGSPGGADETGDAAEAGFVQVSATLGELRAPSPGPLDRIDDLPTPDGSGRGRRR